MCAHCMMFKSKHDVSGIEHLCVLRWKGGGREGVSIEFDATDKGVQNHWAHHILILFCPGFTVKRSRDERKQAYQTGRLGVCLRRPVGQRKHNDSEYPFLRTDLSTRLPTLLTEERDRVPETSRSFLNNTHKFRDGVAAIHTQTMLLSRGCGRSETRCACACSATSTGTVRWVNLNLNETMRVSNVIHYNTCNCPKCTWCNYWKRLVEQAGRHHRQCVWRQKAHRVIFVTWRQRCCFLTENIRFPLLFSYWLYVSRLTGRRFLN